MERYDMYIKQSTCLATLLKQLQQEAGYDTRNANEKVDNDETNVGCARFFEDKRRWIHHRCNRPPNIDSVMAIRRETAICE